MRPFLPLAVTWLALMALAMPSAILALNTRRPTTAVNTDPCLRSAGYWGQNSVGLRLPKADWEKPLGDYCDDSSWDIIMVSFLHLFKTGSPPLPGLNFAYHCEKAPWDGYPYLLSCPDFGAGIKKCQAKGKKVLLSLGGAAAITTLTSDQDGVEYATILWNMFLGGTHDKRPFGDAVLDGIDLDIEGGPSTGFAGVVKGLRALYEKDNRKVYYVSGAPQCPFPDAHLGNALATTWFDFVFIQFYNNFCGIQNFKTEHFNFATWNSYATESKTQLFLGVPAAEYAGAGYQSAAEVVRMASVLNAKYGPGKGWFAGVMQWDVGSSTMNVQGGKSFVQTVSGYLKSAGSCGASQPIPQPPPTATQPSPTRTATSDAPQPTVGTCPVPGSSCNPSIDAPRCAANGGTAKCTRGSAKFWLVTNCPKGTVCKMTRPGRPFCAAPVASDPPLCGGSQPLPAPSPTSTAGPAPTSAPVPCPSAPKPGAKCSTGSDGATCATSNEYAVCVYGTWVVQPCASGTVCKRVNGGGGFVCDWPSTRSEEAVCKDGTMTISGLSPMEKAVLP